MNDTELQNYLDSMKKFKDKIKADKKLSLDLLVRAGICDKEGQLETVYR